MKVKLSLMTVLVTIVTLSIAVNAQDTTSEETPQWTGQISAGWSSARGNSHNDNLSASASAEKRREKDRFSAGADYARSSQKNTTTNQKSTTEDWWRILGQYDYYFQPKWFGFVNGRYETDRIALLDYRALVGAGAGYQLMETDRTKIGFEGGLASKHETYNVTPNQKSNDLTLQVGYRVDHKIVDTVQFLHDLTYYPVIDNFSDYYLTANAEFRANFTKNMFSNFKIIYSRDATPAAGRANSDIKYILGVGWNF